MLSEIKNYREDGRMDRFAFTYPDRVPGGYTDDEISEEAEAAYRQLYNWLYDLEVDRDENGDPVPRRVKFTPKAKEVFREAVNRLDEEMNKPGFPEHLIGPWSKMSGYLARLSLILAMVNFVECGNPSRGLRGWSYEPMVGENDVKAALALVDYFKAHAVRVHSRLRNSGKRDTKVSAETKDKDEVITALRWFLVGRDGHWQGMTSELYEISKTRSVPGLPANDAWFGKLVREIAAGSNDLVLEEGWRAKQPIVKLSLSNLGPVGKAATEGTESKHDGGGPGASDPDGTSVESARLPEIVEAMKRLFDRSTEHKDNSEPDLIAMELAYVDYLDFLPEDSEIEEALDMLNDENKIGGR